MQFSAVVPRTRTGLAVGLALRSHFAASLSSVGASGEDTGCVIHEFGADRWVTIACDSVPAPPHRDRAIARTLGTPMPDAMLGAVIAELRDLPDVRWARSRRVLGLPVDDETPTVASVRSAIGAALNTVHVTALLGYSEQSLSVLPGYPELMPQLPHEGGQKFPAWFAAPAMFGGRGRGIAILGERTLTTEFPPQNAEELADRSTVDLDTAAVVIEYGATNLAIFDTRARGVDLDTSLLRGGHKLRELLDALLADVPRLRTVDQEKPTVEHGQAKSARTRFVVGAVTVVVAVGAVITGVIVQNVTRAVPVTVRVDEGETATLAGGTTITVPRIEARADGRDLIVNTSVRICAGGDIRARDTDPAMQRSVGPANFSLYSQDGMAGERTDGGGPQLAAATIPEGECVDGDLSYRIRDTGSPLTFGYDNAFGDDIVWYDQA